MNVNDLKFGDVLQLMNMFKSSSTNESQANNVDVWLEHYVVCRTYAAGVHVGFLKSYDPKTRHAVLTQSRRIWSWEGAFTLSEVSLKGISGGKIAAPLPEIMISQVEEIIPCSSEASKCLQEKEAYKP